MSLRRSILFVLLALCANSSFAQYTPQIQPILPKAPNSAALEKFGDYEVSMFTGLPNISIPLYTIKTAGFDVPVTLEYHASGLRVTDFPSWVGLGWALDCGGQISRNLVGIPDEDDNGFLTGRTRAALSINNNSYTDVAYLATMAGTLAPYGNAGITSAIGDLGADIFSYSFPGGGGKFFFNKIDSLHFTPVLIPYAPVAISYAKGGNGLSFNIKDAQGNKYRYGTSAQEISIYSEENIPDYARTTAWMLEQAVSTAKADTINFSYQGERDPTPQEIGYTWVVEDLINARSAYGPGGSYYDDNPVLTNYAPFVPAGELPPYIANNGTNTVSQSRSSSSLGSQQPQQITFKNGKVIFELDATARQDFNQTGNSKPLKRIKVYSTTVSGDVLLKTITFYYGYFINGTDATTKRLRLDSIQMSDGNSTVVNSYRFSYNITNNLPGWDSFSKDYWGYYNGRSNSSLIPQQSVYYQPGIGTTDTTHIIVGSTNPIGREPDSVYMQANMLQRIYYPTKGYTDFQYETNKYFDSVSNKIKLAGGLRVKSIKSYDCISATPLIQTYQYGTSGLGRANFYLNSFFFSSEKQHQHYYFIKGFTDPNTGVAPNIGCAVDGTKRVRTFFENPTINIQPFDGSPVVYPFVTEYRSDGTNNLGKTTYRFSDTTDHTVYISDLCSKTNTVTHFYARGHLLDKKTYKTIPSGLYQPVEEEMNTYNTSSFAEASIYGGLLVDQAIIREGLDFQLRYYTTVTTAYDWQFANVYYQSDDNYLTSKTNKMYDANDSTKFVSTTTSLSYTNIIHQQPTQVTTVNSKNEIQEVNTRYPADIATGNTVLDTMLARNIQTVEIEKYSTLQKPSQSAVVTGGQTNLYKLSNGLAVLDKQNRLKVTVPITDYQPATVNGGVLQTDPRYEPIISYNQYDSYGNIEEVQLVNGVKDVYLWGYNHQYPVAKISNSDLAMVLGIVTQAQINSATATPNNDAAVRSLLNTLRTGLPNAMVTTLTYNPLIGATSSTDPKGETTYYEYDSYQRLMNINDKDRNIVKHMDYHYKGH